MTLKSVWRAFLQMLKPYQRMTAKISDIEIICEADADSSDSQAFGQINMKIGSDTIGDQESWSVVGLVVGAIVEIESGLYRQLELSRDVSEFLQELSSKALFDALYSWQWETGEWTYENKCPLAEYDAKIFNAIPLGTEIFDGESAYLILTKPGSSRFIWRDYESKTIKEQPVDFLRYLFKWKRIRHTLDVYRKNKIY